MSNKKFLNGPLVNFILLNFNLLKKLKSIMLFSEWYLHFFINKSMFT